MKQYKDLVQHILDNSPPLEVWSISPSWPCTGYKSGLMVSVFTRHFLHEPVWQERKPRVSVDGVGHISVGLIGEQVHHTGGETLTIHEQHRRVIMYLLKVPKGAKCNLSLQLTLGCLQSLFASQKTENRSKSSYRRLASSSCVHSIQRKWRSEKKCKYFKLIWWAFTYSCPVTCY